MDMSTDVPRGDGPDFSPALWRRFLVFLVPMMIQNVVSSLSGTINNAVLGQMLGVHALAAATAFFPVMLAMFGLVMGAGAGTSVLVGRAHGAGDTRLIGRIAGTAFTATLALGVALAIPGCILAGTLMRLLGTPAPILAAATLYAQIMMAGAPVMFAFYLPMSVLRGMGDSRTPLLMVLVLSGGVVLVPPLIILGFGVASAAIATLSAMAISLAWVTWHLRRKSHPLAPRRELRRILRVDRRILSEIVLFGFPTATQLLTMSAAELILLGLVNRFGADATAAYGAVNLVLSYLQFPAISTAIASSILAAQAIGAGRRATIGRITRTGLTLGASITGALAVVAYAADGLLLRLFLTDAHVVAMAKSLLHIVLWSVVPYGMASVFAGVMRATGMVLMPTLLSVSALACIEVPLALWLSQVRGLDGIWIAYAATFTSMLVLQSGWYLTVWRARERRLADQNRSHIEVGGRG